MGGSSLCSVSIAAYHDANKGHWTSFTEVKTSIAVPVALQELQGSHIAKIGIICQSCKSLWNQAVFSSDRRLLAVQYFILESKPGSKRSDSDSFRWLLSDLSSSSLVRPCQQDFTANPLVVVERYYACQQQDLVCPYKQLNSPDGLARVSYVCPATVVLPLKRMCLVNHEYNYCIGWQ